MGSSGRLLESRLFGVETTDPITWAAAIAIFTLITLAATLVPALAATRVDPLDALRID